MSYELIILPQARKEINKLPMKTALAIFDAIETLAENPLPAGNVRMSNYSTSRIDVRTFNRIKVLKNYRIVYHIAENICTVTIVKVGHRKEVYKK